MDKKSVIVRLGELKIPLRKEVAFKACSVALGASRELIRADNDAKQRKYEKKRRAWREKVGLHTAKE